VTLVFQQGTDERAIHAHAIVRKRQRMLTKCIACAGMSADGGFRFDPVSLAHDSSVVSANVCDWKGYEYTYE